MDLWTRPLAWIQMYEQRQNQKNCQRRQDFSEVRSFEYKLSFSEWLLLIRIQLHLYRPQRSCGQGYVFTRVCDSVHKGGGSPGRENPPPRQGRTPPPHRTRETPRAGRTPLDQETPPGRENPPPTRQNPPPGPGRPSGKQTPEYGLRAAGTHPTGMHSCLLNE